MLYTTLDTTNATRNELETAIKEAKKAGLTTKTAKAPTVTLIKELNRLQDWYEYSTEVTEVTEVQGFMTLNLEKAKRYELMIAIDEAFEAGLTEVQRHRTSKVIKAELAKLQGL